MGVWSVALLCGSIVAACSGTIETPTEEFPPREGGRSQAATDDDNDTPPRTPAATPPANNNPPVASNDDDEELPPAAPADDEEDPPADDPPADDPPAAGTLSFETDIHPIFADTCGPCHAGAGSGGQDIGGPDIESALQDAIDFEDRVIATIESGSMPIGCGGPPGSGGNCMSEEDFADVEAWYEAGAPE
jgi:hypothetical protein